VIVVPGEVRVGTGGPVSLCPGRERRSVVVLNGADRPVQVGSHFAFWLVNEGLVFDRAAAFGFRLDVPAGTSVRFEPGLPREVSLVALAGRRVVPGLVLGRGGVGGAER
jgi:urease beta subunit